jgi:hypothetical protein
MYFFYQPAVGFKPIDVSRHFYQGGNAFKIRAEWLVELLVAIVSIWSLWIIAIGGIIGYKRMKLLGVTLRELWGDG